MDNYFNIKRVQNSDQRVKSFLYTRSQKIFSVWLLQNLVIDRESLLKISVDMKNSELVQTPVFTPLPNPHSQTGDGDLHIFTGDVGAPNFDLSSLMSFE